MTHVTELNYSASMKMPEPIGAQMSETQKHLAKKWFNKLRKVSHLMKFEKLFGLKTEQIEGYLAGGWESKEPKEEEYNQANK